jgi:tetratricopeptide (TPR) repeat protein
MNLSGKKLQFHHKSQTNPYRAVILLSLLIACLFLLRSIEQDQIRSPFSPTPVPTRIAQSYSLEGETHFQAGSLDAAILAYQHAIQLAPNDVGLIYELARIQTYSSTLLTTDEERRQRLLQALDTINNAVKQAPDDSNVFAVEAFVLDWNASNALAGDQSAAYITQAEQAAVRALQLDPQNTLALAYYAEILTDQQKWLQADQYARQALQTDPSLMDVHRINAYVQETLGNYGEAIREYKKAAEITPNLTFLYISIGTNYRTLKQFDLALEYYAKAATIDAQLGVKDPIPYLAIGKTYSQMGQFWPASQNVRKALAYNPNSPDVYGQLGVIYFKGRNYEGAIPALKCAVYGCSAQESCDVRNCDAKVDPQIVIKGMPLTGNTVVYYYTYGSVLAGMHRPKDDYCTESIKVLAQVRAGFPKDATIMSIIKPSEDICSSQ